MPLPRAHVPKLMLHAVPNAPKIDGNHPVEVIGESICSLRNRRMNTSIVEGDVQLTKA
ncbi:MAG TPA: hypothetical protein VGE93_03585 [Bryobacteraceae bacterium]